MSIGHCFVIAVEAIFASAANSAWTINMPVGVTDMSREIYALHMLIFWVCVVIAVMVFGILIYSIVTFRKSRAAIADRTLTHSTKVEVIWTVIPIVILIATAIPAAETLIGIEDTRNSGLTIKVTGYQWKWQYDYLDHGVSFFSGLARDSNAARQPNSGIDPKAVPNYLLETDNHLVVPVNVKVRVLLTAADVIHAWWVPDFGVKKDAVPGFVNEVWFRATRIGIYRGQCAELCGRDHGFMPIVVEVKSRADFNTWLQAHQANPHRPAAAGALAIEPPAATTALQGSHNPSMSAARPLTAAE